MKQFLETGHETQRGRENWHLAKEIGREEKLRKGQTKRRGRVAYREAVWYLKCSW
jgi:protoporphyrinogen oxidase